LQLVSHPGISCLPSGWSRVSAMHGNDEHLHFEGEAEKEVEEGHGCPVPWLRLVEHGGATNAQCRRVATADDIGP